jgi:hypothetical protein
VKLHGLGLCPDGGSAHRAWHAMSSSRTVTVEVEACEDKCDDE